MAIRPPPAARQPPYQYTGRENDGTGLYFYRARYYNPVLQQFISEDPAPDEDRTSLYSYADDDPVSFFDPLGLTTWPGSGRVTSPFGPRGGQFAGFHNGVDIHNNNGTAVVASDGGVVIPVSQNGPGGDQVGIRHPDGSATVYSHTDGLLKPGDQVSEGQPIGCTNASGTSQGNHVHYIYYAPGAKSPSDPLKHLPPQNNYPKDLSDPCLRRARK